MNQQSKRPQEKYQQSNRSNENNTKPQEHYQQQFQVISNENKKRLNPFHIDFSKKKKSIEHNSSSNTDSSETNDVSSIPKLTAQRSVPAFLNKLYNMVEDSSTDDLIRWSKEGISFIVEKHEEFAKTVLPRFYKHNTFASFVRQLNMYDFHKVPHLQQGVLITENEHEIWEFSNPHFQKDRPDLLILVTRKRNKDRDSIDIDNMTLSTLVQDFNLIKKNQSNISDELRDLHRDNEILWQETLSGREKHQKHQDAIEKILTFLTAIFANDNLAIDNINSLPKGLIEEAASLVGANMNITKPVKKSTLPDPPTSTNLSSVLTSVVGLHNSASSEKSTIPTTLNNFSTALNIATGSAQSINQNIDSLQLNIESLAQDLGIDPNRLDEDIEEEQEHMDQNNKHYFNPDSQNFQLNDELFNPSFIPQHNSINILQQNRVQPDLQTNFNSKEMKLKTTFNRNGKEKSIYPYLPMNSFQPTYPNYYSTFNPNYPIESNSFMPYYNQNYQGEDDEDIMDA